MAKKRKARDFVVAALHEALSASDPPNSAIAIERWKREVYDRADKVDPNDEYVWRGVVIGFLLGCGFTLVEAEKLVERMPC